MLATPPLTPRQDREAATDRSLVQEFNLAVDDPPSEFEADDQSDRAIIAKEKRKAVVGVAEAWVQMKGLEAQARMVTQRDTEQQRTERCRIAEEARTRQVERLAQVAHKKLQEEQRTKREREALRAQALREAIQVRGKLQAQELQSRASMLNLFQWMVASLVGAVGATATTGGRSRGRGLRPRRGLSQYVSALILVAFVRHLWLNPFSRSLLVWSSRLGPCFRGMLGQMLHEALQILTQGQTQKEESVRWTAAALVLPRDSCEDSPPTAAERVEEALARLVAGRPLLGPEDAPECWERHEGPHGRIFWHNRALGPAPWAAETGIWKAQEASTLVDCADIALASPVADLRHTGST